MTPRRPSPRSFVVRNNGPALAYLAAYPPRRCVGVDLTTTPLPNPMTEVGVVARFAASVRWRNLERDANRPHCHARFPVARALRSLLDPYGPHFLEEWDHPR